MNFAAFHACVRARVIETMGHYEHGHLFCGRDFLRSGANDLLKGHSYGVILWNISKES